MRVFIWMRVAVAFISGTDTGLAKVPAQLSMRPRPAACSRSGRRYLVITQISDSELVIGVPVAKAIALAGACAIPCSTLRARAFSRRYLAFISRSVARWEPLVTARSALLDGRVRFL